MSSDDEENPSNFGFFEIIVGLFMVVAIPMFVIEDARNKLFGLGGEKSAVTKAANRPPPSKWKPGIEYAYYGENEPCGEGSKKRICLSTEQYVSACSEAVDVTASALKNASHQYMDYSNVYELFNYGSIDSLSIKYTKSKDGNIGCVVRFSLSGLINGSSKRYSLETIAHTFVLTERGTLSVNYMQ